MRKVHLLKKDALLFVQKEKKKGFIYDFKKKNRERVEGIDREICYFFLKKKKIMR
jgi:hypothetical protein